MWEKSSSPWEEKSDVPDNYREHFVIFILYVRVRDRSGRIEKCDSHRMRLVEVRARRHCIGPSCLPAKANRDTCEAPSRLLKEKCGEKNKEALITALGATPFVFPLFFFSHLVASRLRFGGAIFELLCLYLGG